MKKHQILIDTLAEGRIEDVINLLRQLTEEMTLKNDVVLVAGRFKEYETNKNRGTESFTTLSIELNQIRQSLLAIIHQLPETHYIMSSEKDNLKELVKSLHELTSKREFPIKSPENSKKMEPLTAALMYAGGKLIDGIWSESGKKVFNKLSDWITQKKDAPQSQEVKKQIDALEEQDFSIIDVESLKNIFADAHAQDVLNSLGSTTSAISNTQIKEFQRKMKAYIDLLKNMDKLQNKIVKSTDARDIAEWKRAMASNQDESEELETSLKTLILSWKI